MHGLDEVEIVLATEIDIPRITFFLSEPEIDQSFLLPLSSRSISIAERVQSKFPKGFWLIALYRGVVVGCRECTGLVDESSRIVEFSTLAVRVAFQRSGLGSLLIRRASEIALERYDPLMMRLDSWSTNEAMEKAALKAGFVITRIFEDPQKRPPGVQSVEYLLDCSRLKK